MFYERLNRKCQLHLVLLLVMAISAQATINVGDEFTIEFTEPNSVNEHAVTWTPHKKVRQTNKGLIFSNPNNATSVDFGLLTKPYAIGLSWRPT